MRKATYLALALVLLTGFGISGSWAYDIPDTTLVQKWYDGNPVLGSNWVDVIGDASMYNTLGANISNGHLIIFSNWGPIREPQDPGATVPPGGIYTADIFFDTNRSQDNVFEYAIHLDTKAGAAVGTVYYNAAGLAFTTSQDLFGDVVHASAPQQYGGRWDQANPKAVPVLTTDNPIGVASVVWTTLGSSDPQFSVDIDLTGFPDLANAFFLWGTSTCANDVFTGTVPLPPSVLLLGSGLLGLGILSRWRR